MNEKPDSVFRASCDGADLIASGTVIPLSDSPTDISIPMGTNELTVRLSFVEDKSVTGSNTRLSGDKECPELVNLTIVNFHSPMGGGPTEPIRLWKSETADIFLMMRIYSQKDYPPVIHFSFFQKPRLEEKEEPK